MELIGFYVLFAVTTAIAAQYELIWPVMRELELHNPEDNMVKHKFISYSVFFLISLLFAPILIIPTIFPTGGSNFRAVLLQSLMG